MRVQDRGHLVLDPRAVPDHLVAPRHEPPPAFGVSIGQPDLGQKVGGPQRRQNTGIDLVGLDVRMGDRLDLQRVGDDHPSDIGREHADHCHRVAGRLDDDLVLFAEAAAERRQSRARHVDASH